MWLKINNEVFIADLITSSYVLMLERWMLPFLYIQRSTVLLVRDIVYEDCKMLFSWFKHKFICSDVRALNATIFVYSTPNSIIGEEYFSWRSQISFSSWFKHDFICPDVRALNPIIFVHSTPNSIIGRGYCVGRSQLSFLADLCTTSYVLILERWILPFSYFQRPTVLLVRNIVHEDHQWVF